MGKKDFKHENIGLYLGKNDLPGFEKDHKGKRNKRAKR